jgi:NAD+ diphosphatase
MGFYCDLDGSDAITLDENELECAEWIRREDIDVEADGISLTNEMIMKFKER